MNEEINLISTRKCQKYNKRKTYSRFCSKLLILLILIAISVTDIGSGGGFPGIIVSILIKNLEKKHKS